MFVLVAAVDFLEKPRLHLINHAKSRQKLLPVIGLQAMGVKTVERHQDPRSKFIAHIL